MAMYPISLVMFMMSSWFMASSAIVTSLTNVQSGAGDTFSGTLQFTMDEYVYGWQVTVQFSEAVQRITVIT